MILQIREAFAQNSQPQRLYCSLFSSQDKQNLNQNQFILCSLEESLFALYAEHIETVSFVSLFLDRHTINVISIELYDCKMVTKTTKQKLKIW